jgi:hypothetical protein
MNPQKNNIFKLEDLKKENPFQVPENYFDTLGNRIADRIETREAAKRGLSFASVKLKPILSFAGGFAALAFFIYLGVSFLFTFTGQSGEVGNPDLADLTEYSIISELDQTLLIEEFSVQTQGAADSLNSMNQENIIDYLVKQDIDISTIIDEL